MIELVKYQDANNYFEYLKIENNSKLKWIGISDSIKNIFSAIFLLHTAYNGEILYNGKNIKDLDNGNYQNFINNYSLVFDRGGLLSNQSLRDNILLPFQYHKKNLQKVEQKIENYFNKMNYKQYLDKRPYYVPENLRKFSVILRGVLWQPKVLFIENFSMGLEVEDLKFFEKLLVTNKIGLHYYDSLDKFFLKGFDTLNINQPEVVSA